MSIESEVDTLLAMNAGITVILASLIAKHPNYEQFQLHLTSVMEIADQSAAWKVLNEKQREQARAYVEQLQQIRAVRGEIRPLPPGL